VLLWTTAAAVECSTKVLAQDLCRSVPRKTVYYEDLLWALVTRQSFLDVLDNTGGTEINSGTWNHGSYNFLNPLVVREIENGCLGNGRIQKQCFFYFLG